MKGLYLFLDNHSFEPNTAIRTVNSPVRKRETPILRNVANFSNTVIRTNTGTYRAWLIDSVDPETLERYTIHTTSPNGVTNWTAFTEIIGTRGKEFSDLMFDNGRYFGYRRYQGQPNRWYGELMLSTDGLHWQSQGIVTPERYGESWQPFKLANHYGLLHRWNVNNYTWRDKEGVEHTNVERDPFVRCIGLTVSTNPAIFPASRLLFAPDEQDSGEAQFYAVSNIQERILHKSDKEEETRRIWIGCLSVLHDDWTAEGAKPGAYGMGYSVLIWSYDGVNWTRGREPFFSPNPTEGTWDHAVTWIDSIVPTGNDVRFYYGGYRHGHKVHTDRSIGLVVGRKDRYIGVRGVLRTKSFVNTNNSLRLNMDGRVKVRVLDSNNVLLGETGEIVADGLDKQVMDLRPYKRQRIKIELDGGTLYSMRLV
jgi:hypothetical protein